MSIRSLAVLLLAVLAFPANVAADDDDDSAYTAAVRTSHNKRFFQSTLQRMQILAGRLESEDDAEKEATLLRKALKLASDRDIESQFDQLIRALVAKNADRNLELLDAALRDSRKLSTDLKALRLEAEKSLPSQMNAPALRRELTAARVALERDGEKIDKELTAYFAKRPAAQRPAGTLAELLERVSAGQSGVGKSARGGGGEGRGGRSARASQHKPGEKGAGRAKELPKVGVQFRNKAHAFLEALDEGLADYRRAFEQLARELKGKVRADCEGLASRLEAVRKRMGWQLAIHELVERLAEVEERSAEVDGRIRRVREELMKKQSKD
jgi:hypothetical protein